MRRRDKLDVYYRCYHGNYDDNCHNVLRKDGNDKYQYQAYDDSSHNHKIHRLQLMLASVHDL